MPPVKTAVPPQAAPVYDAYLACAGGPRGGQQDVRLAAPAASWPGSPTRRPGRAQPLAARLAGTRPQLQPLLNFLMLHGHLRPGYDYLLDRKLTVILREAAASPLGPDLERFLAGAEALGYSVRARTGMASEVAIRVLIQTGRALGGADRRRLRRVRAGDHRAGSAAGPGSQALPPRALRLPRGDLPPRRPGRAGAQARPRWAGGAGNATWTGSARRSAGRWSPTWNGCRAPTPAPRVQGTASELAHFGRFLARHDPGLSSLAAAGPAAPHRALPDRGRRGGQPPHRRSRSRPPPPSSRIQTVGSFLDAIAEWGWPEAPARRLIFPRDAPEAAAPAAPLPAPRRRTARCWPRWRPRRTGCAPTRCCCCGPPGCASASCSTSSWTACTRSPAPAPG